MYLLIKRKVCINFNNYKIESILQSTKCQYLFFINWFSLYLRSFLAFVFGTEGKSDFVSLSEVVRHFQPNYFHNDNIFLFSLLLMHNKGIRHVPNTKAATVQRHYHTMDHLQNENTIYLV